MLKSGLVSLGSVGLGLGSRLGLGSPLGALRLCPAYFAAEVDIPPKPDYPKHPVSAWNLFVGKKLKGRKNFKRKWQEAGNMTTLMLKVGMDWRALPQCEKDPLAQKAKAIHECYHREMNALPVAVREAHPTLEKKRSSQRRRRELVKEEAKLGAPKAPLHPWPAFLRDYFSGFVPGHISSKPALRSAAVVWKLLPAEQRERLRADYDRQKEKYLENYQSWEQALSREKMVKVRKNLPSWS